MLKYSVLTSGSCGNAYVFYDGKSSILIDMGLTVTGLRKRLDNLAIPVESIKDLYLTHMHPDHSKGAGTLHRAFGVSVHSSRTSFDIDKSLYLKLGLDEDKLLLFEEGEVLTSGDFTITPFKTMHDSAGSMGYRIEHGANKIFLMTDTGVFSEDSVAFASDSDLLFLESNYDEELLAAGRYPLFLKRRIAGERGHLSNTQAFDFLSRFSLEGKRVYLVHISANNNDTALLGSEAEKHLLGCLNYTVCERGQGYSGELS